jgi:hypothetical protein
MVMDLGLSGTSKDELPGGPPLYVIAAWGDRGHPTPLMRA